MSAYTTEPRFDADDVLGIDAELDADDRLRNGTRNGARHESIVGLLRELTRDGRELMSLEMELAKTEVREKVDVYQRNTVVLAIGGGLLLAALLLGAWTANMALTALLSTFMAVEIAVWLAPLLLTITLGAIGFVLFFVGTALFVFYAANPERGGIGFDSKILSASRRYRRASTPSSSTRIPAPRSAEVRSASVSDAPVSGSTRS